MCNGAKTQKLQKPLLNAILALRGLAECSAQQELEILLLIVHQQSQKTILFTRILFCLISGKSQRHRFRKSSSCRPESGFRCRG